MENILDLWNKALQKIETKLSKPSFETWMKSTKAHSLQGDTLTITAPNEFARDWLESRYLHLIADTIYELTGEELKDQIYHSSKSGRRGSHAKISNQKNVERRTR